MLRYNKNLEESSEEFTTTHIHHKQRIAHQTNILTSISSERQYSSDRCHQHSINSKNEIKKVMMIDAYQPPPLERPSSVPVTIMDGNRTKNFRVRVYRNGDDSICAYCASCSMNLIFADATRKLQLIRPARRLFDSNGCEIFQSEHIQRGMEYFVSGGDDFINPLEAIEAKIQYRLQSRWTIYGIKSSYIRIQRRRRRRRQQRTTSIKYSELINDDSYLPNRHDNKGTQTGGQISFDNKGTQTGGQISFDNKDTQTIIKCENKSIQTDRKVLLDEKNTQTTMKYESKQIQTDGKTSLDNKDTQTTTYCDNKDTQTESKVLLDNKDTQTTIKCEDKDIQTDGKILLYNKDTQTATQHNTKTTQTDIEIIQLPSPIDIPPPRTDAHSPTFGGHPPRPRRRIPVASLHEPIYRRATPVTNFRVRVYRNGEHDRHAYCKSCSMNILLSAATEKLQLPIPARRLFDVNGYEIFDSRDIERDAEYFVSSGGNFIKPSQ